MDGLEKFVDETARSRVLELSELAEIWAAAATLEELAEVWRAAATLGYPQRHAIQLRILLPLPAEVIGSLATSTIREVGRSMVWDRSFEGAPESGRQGPRVLPAAVADLIRDAIPQRASPSELILQCRDGRAVDWAACKRAVARGVQRQRREAGRRPQAAWHLDELASSFEAIVITTLGVDRALARRCQEKLDKFRSLHRHAWAESDACAAEVADVLRRWSELIAAFTRHSMSEEVHLVDSGLDGDP